MMHSTSLYALYDYQKDAITRVRDNTNIKIRLEAWPKDDGDEPVGAA